MALGKLGDYLGKVFDFNDEADEDYVEEEAYVEEETETRTVPNKPSATQYRSNNVVAMSNPAPKGAKIELYEPRLYSDAKEVGRNLLENTAVLVNFTHLENGDAKRIVDFLTGVVFAVNGEIKRVGDQIFLVTPANFEVSGALASKLTDDLNLDDLQ